MTRTRQPKNSDQAYSVTLTTKVSETQMALIHQSAGEQPLSEWLRQAAVAAYTAQQATKDRTVTTRSCTWVNCGQLATHPRYNKNDVMWANLCDCHHAEMTAALDGIGPQQILSCWIKAQGGVKAAARRI